MDLDINEIAPEGDDNQSEISGLTVQNAPDTRRPLSERKKQTLHAAGLLFPIVRVVLGNTSVREVYRAARFGKPIEERFLLKPWVEQIISPKNLPGLLNKAGELGFFKGLPSIPTVADYDPAALWGTTEESSDSGELSITVNAPNYWAVIRAMNLAISRSNYRNWMQFQNAPDKAPKFCYTLEHDGKIRQMPFTGEMSWCNPETVTISWRPAETEEEFLRPFITKWIADPEDESKQIQIRVFRRVANVYHGDTGVEEHATLRQLIDQMHSGDSKSVNYSELFRDENDGTNLRQTEFERKAESDTAFADAYAQELGINLFTYINHEERIITLYHGGFRNSDRTVA